MSVFDQLSALRRALAVVWAGALLGSAAVPAPPAHAGGASAAAPEPSEDVGAAPPGEAAKELPPQAEPEVVTVIGEKPELDAAARRRIYRDHATGSSLYDNKRIKEAFPYLLSTAKHGFKDSQARVGHIYAYGLGDIERDTPQAVGWLGVASSGQTSTLIRNYFDTIWARIPETHMPYFEEVVDEYRTKYGERATGVVCQMHRPARSRIKRLGCLFEQDLDEHTETALTDHYRHLEDVRKAQEEQERQWILTQEQIATGIRDSDD